MTQKYVKLVEESLTEAKEAKSKINVNHPYYALEPFLKKVKKIYALGANVDTKDIKMVRNGYTKAQANNPKLKDVSDAQIGQYITGALLPIEKSERRGDGWLSNSPGDTFSGIKSVMKRGR
jgi:hypothetical protein